MYQKHASVSDDNPKISSKMVILGPILISEERWSSHLSLSVTTNVVQVTTSAVLWTEELFYNEGKLTRKLALF